MTTQAPALLANAASDADAQKAEQATRSQELWGVNFGRWRFVPHLDAMIVGIADRRPLGLPLDNMQLLVTRLWPGIELRAPMFRAVVQVENFRLRSSGNARSFRLHRFGLFQAFLQLTSKPVVARLGRQVVPIDDMRLLDQVVFRAGVFFDGLLLRFKGQSFQATFFGGMRDSWKLRNEDKNNVSALAFGRMSWQASTLLTFSPFLFYRYDAPSLLRAPQGGFNARNYRSIAAPGLAVRVGDLRRWFQVSGAGQFGIDDDNPHKAYAFGGQFSYTGTHRLRPMLELGSIIASGAADDGSVSEFDNFYLNPWLRQGYGGAFALRNVVQGSAKASITATVFDKQLLQTEIAAFVFGLADRDAHWTGAFGFPISGPSQGASNLIGSEVDLMLTYIPTQWLVLRFVYAGFFPGPGAYDRGVVGPQHRGLGITQIHF